MHLFKNFIGIAILTLLVLGIINFKEKIKPKLQSIKVWQNINQQIEIFKHNLSFTISPKRKRPFSFVEREARLFHLAPSAFGQFSTGAWKEFWNLIYEPIEEKQDSFMVKRYRTHREIENHLKNTYLEPFTLFERKHWNSFWKIALGK